MRILVGTSGYSYPQWRGSFYPEKIDGGEMLAFYASRLSIVEINNTFYRIPKAPVVKQWTEQAPLPFQFVIKVSQRVSHRAKLAGDDAQSSMQYLMGILRDGEILPQTAALLIQTPGYLKCNDATLTALDGLLAIAAPTKVAMELQSSSWANAEAASLLSRHNATAVIADKDDGTVDWDSPLLACSSNWDYVRLRRENYTADELTSWLTRLRERNRGDTLVFFKHEDTARGAEMAMELAALAR